MTYRCYKIICSSCSWAWCDWRDWNGKDRLSGSTTMATWKENCWIHETCKFAIFILLGIKILFKIYFFIHEFHNIANGHRNHWQDSFQWRRQTFTLSTGNNRIIKRWFQENWHVGSRTSNKLHANTRWSLRAGYWGVTKQNIYRGVTNRCTIFRL